MAANDMTPAGPFGLLGRTLGHSFSPMIHACLGSTPYALIEREPEEVASFIREGSWRGINVTIPYKRLAAELADEVSERVRRLGVANTLVRRPDDTIFADNTDVLGFAWMLERFAGRHWGRTATEALRGRKVLVLGSGGASQAAQAALQDTGAHIVVISRSGAETYATLTERHRDAVLVVNTTPVGTFPNCPDTPVAEEDLARLTDLAGVLDVVYNPERTGIVMAAERLEIPAESGLAMLVSQALFASEAFQGRTLDHSLAETLEQDIRRATRNVCFIGMPGSGKTSAARRLARLLGRPFVDLDDSFAVDHGISCAACIRERGEEAFRALETETCAAYARQSGLIIACGGGIVTRPENYPHLHQNSTIIMLDRPLRELSVTGRPLSQSRGVERLAEERMGLYRAWADVILECTGSAAGDAVAVRQILGL